MKKNKSRRRRVLRWTLVVVAVLLVIPALQVATLWFINPPTTGPILIRWCAGKISSKPYIASKYQWVDLNSVSVSFSSFVWSWEDCRFFEHWGFDGEEILEAMAEARKTGKPARGASTITQQCARSLFLWHGRSWPRKGLEAYYTIWMELLLSKRRIFELYVNVIEFGDGVYGIESASRYYYGVSSKELSREQAALLVAVLSQPRVLDPRHPTEKMLWRQAKILERSKNLGFPIKE